MDANRKRKEKKIRKELLIIVPAHNEEKNIRTVFDCLERDHISDIADILVINDASSDGTEAVITDRGYHHITNRSRVGYGRALQQGYRYACRHEYRYVIHMDADGQHDTCNIQEIYKRLLGKDSHGRSPDIVMASRYMEGSSAFPVSIWRRMAYALFRVIIRRVTGRRIADPTTGLQGLNRRVFQYYAGKGHYDKYPDANIIIQMLLLGYRIVEMPAVMHVRSDGRSMHRGFRAVWYMLRMFCSITAVVIRIKVLKME